MTVSVWPTPSYTLGPAAVSLLPVVYAEGKSTSAEGNCLSVLDGTGKTIARWGSGAWQRAQVS